MGRGEKFLNNGRVGDLNFRRKLLPAFVGILTVAVPAMVGLISAPSLQSQTTAANRPSFEVISVKLHKDSGVGPRGSRTAYGPEGVEFGARQISFLMGKAYGGPYSHINDNASRQLDFGTGYDIVAKAGHPVSRPQIRLMLQSLLEEHLKLRFHRETKTESVYKLVVAGGGRNSRQRQTTGTPLSGVSAMKLSSGTRKLTALPAFSPTHSTTRS